MDRYTLNRQIEEHPDAKLKDLVVQMLYDDIISLDPARDQAECQSARRGAGHFAHAGLGGGR